MAGRSNPRHSRRRRQGGPSAATVIGLLVCVVCFSAAFFLWKAALFGSRRNESGEEPFRPVVGDPPYRVCIDAGHGGSDCGADYAGAYEKDETLLIARLVKRHLESVGVKVLMTRDADTYLGLDERVEICNNASCDVLVSIHRNLYEDDPSINGVETWIHHELPEDDVFLAEAITTRLDAIAGIKSRGVRGGSMTDSEEDYRLNRNTRCVSCLVELGFMSNANDNRLITEKSEETASAISDGIMEYLNSRK